ncbi:MAG: 50S ribosomal protein L15 [Patescibacteria group bacterium]|jgi:large subunit ribosomal protein L15
MSLSLSNLRPATGSKKHKKRVGRGQASGHGTTATRGGKGQRARAGGRGGLKIKGLKARLQKIPKLRGFRSPYPKNQVINLSALEKNFSAGGSVTPEKLFKNGLLSSLSGGVKILGEGKLTKKLMVKGCSVSASAKEQILKAGGQVV